MNIIQALRDPNLLGADRDPETWRSWDVVLKAAYALPMAAGELETFRQLTGREPPAERVRELWAVCGRRSGKTKTAADIVTYLAAFPNYRRSLSRGEKAVCMLLAADRQQAAVALDYIKGHFSTQPMLRKMVERETASGLDLSNGAKIEIHTSNYRAVRGRSLACVVFDEAAFWRDDTSTNPAEEVYRAVVPGLATLDNALLIGISTPYRRAGLLWQKYQKHYGQPGDVLIVKGPTTAFNPTIDQRIIDGALESDPTAARAEWEAEWRDDVTGFLDGDWIEAAIERRGTIEPREGVRYHGFADPAGAGKDEFSLAIGHLEGRTRVVDLVLGQLGSPHSIVSQYAAVLMQYGLREVVGDKYASGWVKDAFREFGISYRYAAMNRSEIYLEVGPLFATGLVKIPDDPKLIAQLRQLERRTGRQGKDQVDHPPHGSDDRSNAVAGVLQLCAKAHRHGPRVSRLESPGDEHRRRIGLSEGARAWDGSGNFGDWLRNG